MKKRIGSICLSGVALLAVCSVLVHPFGAIKAQRSDKPLLLDSTFDPQVVRTLEKSCQNCHSEKTEWPWYSYVAPMSWMIEKDVHDFQTTYSQHKEVRTDLTLIQLLIALFVFFVAGWLAQIMARQISVPISALARAAEDF